MPKKFLIILSCVLLISCGEQKSEQEKVEDTFFKRIPAKKDGKVYSVDDM